MENKLTDNEIVKALEYCSQQGSMSECERCKIKRGCRFELIKLAFDLINRLQAEKEALINGQETLQKYIAEQQAEIENLKIDIATLEAKNYVKDKLLEKAEEKFKNIDIQLEASNKIEKVIKAEAYKECIEKVKEKSKKTQIVCTGAVITIGYSISHKNLEILLKELVGEK